MDDKAAELHDEILAVKRWAESQGGADQSYAQHLGCLADKIKNRGDDSSETAQCN